MRTICGETVHISWYERAKIQYWGSMNLIWFYKVFFPLFIYLFIFFAVLWNKFCSIQTLVISWLSLIPSRNMRLLMRFWQAAAKLACLFLVLLMSLYFYLYYTYNSDPKIGLFHFAFRWRDLPCLARWCMSEHMTTFKVIKIEYKEYSSIHFYKRTTWWTLC